MIINRSLIFAAFAAASILISCPGCETVDKWQWEAGRIFFANKGINNCIARCRILSDEMKAQGVTHYIISGYYRHKRHRWIEKDGVILDPSVSLTSPDLYSEVARLKVEGDKVGKK